MSVRTTIDIFCDGDGCPAWTGQTDGLGGENAREIRRAAKVFGWVRRGGEDLCIECDKGGSTCWDCEGTGLPRFKHDAKICIVCDGKGVIYE